MKKFPLILGIIFICISCSLIFFWQNLYGIQGTVEVAQIKIAPKITGYLSEFSLKPGDKTESGQELAAISRPQLEKELSEQSDALDEATMELEALKNTTYTEEKIITTAPAKTAVNNPAAEKAKKKYEHYKQLYAEDIISRNQLDEARRAYEALNQAPKAAENSARIVQVKVGPKPEELKAAQDKITKLQAQVDHTLNKFDNMLIFSPFQGTVRKVMFKNGDYIEAGQPLLILENPRECWTTLSISSKKAAHLSSGQIAKLHSPDLPGKTFTGTVESIKPQNQFSRRVKIKLLNDELLLQANMSIILRI